MRCPQAQILMTKRLREPLPVDEARALERHLSSCSTCRAELDDLQPLETALLRAQPGAPPTVRVNTAAITGAGSRASGFPRWVPALALGAAAAAVALGVASRTSHPQPEVSRPGNAERQPAVALQTAPVEREQPLVRVPREAPRDPALVPILPERLEIARTMAPARERKPGAERPALQRPDEPGVALQRPELPALVPAQLQRDSHVLAVAFQVPPPVPAPPGRVDAALRGNPRLEAPLTLEEKNRPLRELLPQLGRKLGVRLGAGRETGDDKATLCLTARPAAEALSLLARHLGFRWVREGEEYRLIQDLAGKQREQALLRNELAPIETQLNLAVRWLREPLERKKARVEEIDALLKAGGLVPAEQARLGAEKQTILDVWLSPASVQPSLDLFRALTPAQLDALLDGSEFRYSTATGTLPAPLAEKIHDSTAILETQYGPLPRVQADVTIRLTDVEDADEVPPSRRQRQLRLETHFSTVRGTREDPHYWGGGWSPHIPALPEAAPATEPLSDPDLARAVDLVLPGPAKQPLPVSGHLIASAQLGAVWPEQATVGDVAAAIHRATGLDVVADSFVPARLNPALLRGRKPLVEVLQKVAEELDYTWEKRGKLLLLRDRRFYRDRPAEVPDRIVKPFRERVLRAGALDLDELAGLVAALDDTQVRSMHRYWGWYLGTERILPTATLFQHRQHLRFWAGLSPAQRSALRAGQSLPVAQLLPAQRGRWAAALTSPPESANTPSEVRATPTPADMEAGEFRLSIAEQQLLMFTRAVPDGSRRTGASIVAEGPPSSDVRKLAGDGFDELEPGRQVPMLGYAFQYYLGGKPNPVRKTTIMLPLLQPEGRTR